MKVGDRVRIKSEKEIKANPKLYGSCWTPGMFAECGKFGRILKIDPDGDYYILTDREMAWYFPSFAIVESSKILNNE